MNGYGSKWKSRNTLPATQTATMAVWMAMNAQLPMNVGHPVGDSRSQRRVLAELPVDRVPVGGLSSLAHVVRSPRSAR